MITKVVLGVALVLIEFSISTFSQNNSLSSINDTTITIKYNNVSEHTATDENSISSPSSYSSTSTTIKLSNISNFITTNVTESPVTTTNTLETTATSTAASADFVLPENCASYKVSLVWFRVIVKLFHLRSFLAGIYRNEKKLRVSLGMVSGCLRGFLMKKSPKSSTSIKKLC